jgi:hypothetical protein
MVHLMELLFILAALIALCVLALRFGYDSRSNFQSKEEELASFGMSWDAPALHAADLRREAALAHQVRLALAARPRRSALRRTTAQGLRALAAWLSPELSAVSYQQSAHSRQS